MSAREKYITEKVLNQLRARLVNENGHLDCKVMEIFDGIRKELLELGYHVTYDNFNNVLRVIC